MVGLILNLYGAINVACVVVMKLGSEPTTVMYQVSPSLSEAVGNVY